MARQDTCLRQDRSKKRKVRIQRALLFLSRLLFRRSVRLSFPLETEKKRGQPTRPERETERKNKKHRRRGSVRPRKLKLSSSRTEPPIKKKEKVGEPRDKPLPAACRVHFAFRRTHKRKRTFMHARSPTLVHHDSLFRLAV